MLSFGYEGFVNVRSRLILDSQQPRLELCIEKKSNGLVIFTTEDCDFHFAREGIELEDAETFRQYRFSLPQIFADGKRHMRRPPTMIGFPPQNADSPVFGAWERLLVRGVNEDLILWGQWSDPAWRFLSKGWKIMSCLQYLLRLPFGKTDPMSRLALVSLHILLLWMIFFVVRLVVLILSQLEPHKPSGSTGNIRPPHRRTASASQVA